MVELYGDERLDYLLADEEMRIIQSPSVFSFSLMLCFYLTLLMSQFVKATWLIYVQETV